MKLECIDAYQVVGVAINYKGNIPGNYDPKSKIILRYDFYIYIYTKYLISICHPSDPKTLEHHTCINRLVK